MDSDFAQLLAVLAAVVALYGKVFGPYQFQIVEWVVDAFLIRSRYRGLVNLGVGVGLSLAFGLIASWQMDNWNLLPMGLLAGVLASVEASKVHDGQPPGEVKQGGAVPPQR